ncbi:hypothetical protein ACFWBN_24210 [Streptomyces sp. NPDC059989]|uniref:hypothetical protein n=1 Tax=Streptomyces sp. NPDC059989 TaxID=3347026 RepID=UPI0036CBB045
MVVGLWHWIERHSAGLTLLAPFLAIGGGLLGNWLGAKVQAAGGLAQASAAREAAWIAAEAYRLAALRDERRTAAAEYVRTTRRFMRLTLDLYRQERDDEADIWDEVDLALADLQLSASSLLSIMAMLVMEALQASLEAARLRGPAARAMDSLVRAANDGSAAGRAAYVAVTRAREALHVQSPDCEARKAEAVDALRQCGLLDSLQIQALAIDMLREPLVQTQEARWLQYRRALVAFSDVARESLEPDSETMAPRIQTPRDGDPRVT